MIPYALLSAAHLLAIVITVAVITVTDYLHFLGLRSPLLERTVLRSYPNVSDLLAVLVSLVFLATGLLIAERPTVLADPAFQYSIVLLVIAALNGIFLHHKFLPDLMEESAGDTLRPRTTPRAAMSGAISFSTWYTLVFLAMGPMPGLRPIPFLIGYFIVIAIFFAIAVRLETLAQERHRAARTHTRKTKKTA